MSNSCDQAWYVRAFGELYPLIYAHRSEAPAQNEISNLTTALNFQGCEQILDLCSGGGRHLETLRSLGFKAFGLDLSPQLLHQARARFKAPPFVRADMRAIPFKNIFDAIFNLFSSFGYFLDDRENVLALSQANQALKNGGIIVIDHINRVKLEKNIVPLSVENVNGMKVTQRRRIENNRVIKTIDIVMQDSGVLQFTENVRLYQPAEMIRLLEQTGFSRIELFGGFNCEILTSHADRMIAVARKI